MANALFVDALKGYEYYLSQRGKANFDQINVYLLQSGRNPIAHRTYTHYKKLLRNGFRSYISINKFDVFESMGKIQIAADRRRYHRDTLELNAEFSRDGLKWVKVKIIDRSIVGFGILTERKFPTSTGISGWIRLKGYHDIPVVIVWKQHDQDRTRIGIRAMEFIAKFRSEPIEGGAKERSLKVLTVKRETDDVLDWDNFYSILAKIDELIKSSADLIYSLEGLYDTEVHVRQSSLKLIRFGSPGETSIKVDFGIAEIMRLILEKIQFWGLQKRKLRAEVETQELNNQAMLLANENAKIELARNAVKFGNEFQNAPEIIRGMRKIMPSVFEVNTLGKVAFAENSPELAILESRIIPAAVDLAAGDDADIIVSIGDE